MNCEEYRIMKKQMFRTILTLAAAAVSSAVLFASEAAATTASDVDKSKVLTYTGYGDDVVALSDYGDYFYYEIEGNKEDRYFGVIAYDAQGNRMGSLVNTTIPYHGNVFENTMSAASLEVKAEGSWTIKVKSIYTATAALRGDTIKGNGDDVIVIYEDKGLPTTASIEGNKEDGYFGVICYDVMAKRLGSVVNTTEPYSGTVMLKNGVRVLEVLSEGAWTITLN